MMVGAIACRSRPIVSSDSANATVTPSYRYMYRMARSNEWLNGRNDSAVSSEVIEITWREARMFDRMFVCVSITPLGSPVVPDV